MQVASVVEYVVEHTKREPIFPTGRCLVESSSIVLPSTLFGKVLHNTSFNGQEKITNIKVHQEKLLDPSIVIFRTNNIQEEDVAEFFNESYGIAPVSVLHKVTGVKASRIYVRCSPELYQLLPTEKRIRIKWEFLSFVDAINPRLCKKCCRFGHSDKFCRASEEYITFVNAQKEIT